MNTLSAPADFDLDAGLTYLNVASIAPLLCAAHASQQEWTLGIRQGAADWFDESAEAAVYEPLRRAAARLIDARPEDIAVGSSSTELISSLAWSLAPVAGRRIVSTTASFPSTILPWIRVSRAFGSGVHLVPVVDGLVDPTELIEAIDERTDVVCLSEVEFGSGQRHPLKEITRHAHECGALVVVDGSQSIGALPHAVSHTGVDALVCCGYKWLCGPFGAAFLYLSPELQARDLAPGAMGFRSREDIWNLDVEEARAARTARRFESGSSAYGAAIALAAAIDYIDTLGIERIQAHNTVLAKAAREGLQALGATVGPLGGEPGSEVAIVTARFPGMSAEVMGAALTAERVAVSARRGCVRLSPHFYNSLDDVERCLDVAATILRSRAS